MCNIDWTLALLELHGSEMDLGPLLLQIDYKDNHYISVTPECADLPWARLSAFWLVVWLLVFGCRIAA